MSLSSGTRLGRYEIRSQLGAGGMGEVYLAQDMKLDRTVALKILPSNLASDQNHMRRFVQEARTASSLSHPNVAHIYEIEELDGLHFIAMEYVDDSGAFCNIAVLSIDSGTSRALTKFKSDRISRLAWSRDGKQIFFGRGPTDDDLVLIKDFR